METMGTVCSSHMEPVLIPPSQRKPFRQGGKKGGDVAAEGEANHNTRLEKNALARNDDDDRRKFPDDMHEGNQRNGCSTPRPLHPFPSSAPAHPPLHAQPPPNGSPSEQPPPLHPYSRPPLDESADLAAQEQLANVLYGHLSPMPSGSTSCSSGFPRMLVDVRPSASDCMTQDMLPSSRCCCDLRTPRENQSQSIISGGCPHCRQLERNHKPYNPLSQWSASSMPHHSPQQIE